MPTPEELEQRLREIDAAAKPEPKKALSPAEQRAELAREKADRRKAIKETTAKTEQLLKLADRKRRSFFRMFRMFHGPHFEELLSNVIDTVEARNGDIVTLQVHRTPNAENLAWIHASVPIEFYEEIVGVIAQLAQQR